MAHRRDLRVAYPKTSVLRTVQVPDRSGDTVWANTVAALQELPVPMQRFLETLCAVHGNDFDYAAARVELDDEAAKKCRKLYATKVTKTEHPVVRVHPDTGERSPVLGHYAHRFVGYNTQDSDHLFALLQSPSRGWKTPCAGTGRRATWRSGTPAPPSTTRSTTTATRSGWCAV